MLPFTVKFESGTPVYEQVIYAVKRAIVIGQLKPGDPFPSVRKLSQELRINPNTAHKAVAVLIEEKLLEVQPGIGTVVSEVYAASRQQKAVLLGKSIEQLVVETMRLGVPKEELFQAITKQWEKLK